MQRPINIITRTELFNIKIAPVENQKEFYIYLDLDSKHYTALIRKTKRQNSILSTATMKIDFNHFIDLQNENFQSSYLQEIINLSYNN